MRVLKFGGSSVANPERILAVIDILKNKEKDGEDFTVVFSAFGGITDTLIKASQLASTGDLAYKDVFDEIKKRHLDAAKILTDESAIEEISSNHEDLESLLQGIFLIKEVSNRTMDHVLSFGERNSNYIISKALQKEGIDAEYLDARKIISTNDQFGNAKVNFKTTNAQISDFYKDRKSIQVVTGFVASAPDGSTSTLGRGGSDYTAAILGAALNAEAVEIWTDVDGVLTANPKLVKKAFSLKSLTYTEAMEMSHFGAKVIYAPTIHPALQKEIPLYIKNTFKPDFPGTIISKEKDIEYKNVVKGISAVNEISLMTLQGNGMVGVPGIAARLFGALSDAGINIILITQASSEQSISFATATQDADLAKAIVDHKFDFEIKAKRIDPLVRVDDLCIVAIIGENMKAFPGIAGKLFQILGRNGINVVAIAQGSSELNISFVVKKQDVAKAQNAIHDVFFLSENRQLNLFIVGVGLIGGTLIEQIKDQRNFLKDHQKLEINICGLANSRRMIFDYDGLNIESWHADLDGGEVMNLESYIENMKAMNLSNSVFIDNTATDQVSPYYKNILDASISISTPNKTAASSTYDNYAALKSLAAKRNVQFMYEANVGAGLPIISTLNDLISSGDEILKIEGVLSGSLSYVFNNFTVDQSFSEVVKKAKELGYTEPDPREDLSGLDVRRKIVILARETGISMEKEEVIINGILPEECLNADSVDDFFESLENNNDLYSDLITTANEKNEKLRMVAILEDGKARIGLESVDQDHPFYNLSGSDNMLVFTTERYKERPLVIVGPGAGAQVTAAGVFAEIIRIGNYLS